MSNKDIAMLLRHVAAAFSIKNEKKYYFQIVAYQKAADAIENATSEVKHLVNEEKLQTLPGVGTSIRQHLEELIKTGKVKHFETILEDIPKAMFPLLSVPGFGPKKAYKLVTAFSLSNEKTVLDDIEQIAIEGKIAPLEGFGEKSQGEIRRAVQEFKKGQVKKLRMLLPFAEELSQKIIVHMRKLPEVAEIFPLGSLRRKKPTIGDLDFAIATENGEKVIEHFVNYPYKERIIEQGPTSASIIVSGGYQVDLMTQPVKRFGSLLQHFTGSKHHNIHLRELALKKHLSLSEYGIKHLQDKEPEFKPYKTEESFYNALGMEWIPPEIREDMGEIERALENTVPKLITVADIKGDLHIHSSYPIEPSHDMGANTMEEMLAHAEKLGYAYLGFSEHNPSISKHTKEQVYSILSKRRDKIEQLNSSHKNIRVINLLETDILVNGDLAIDSKSLETLDATIVSIHSSFSMDAEQMTKRVLQGLSHPKAKILAHPTGRMVNGRSGYTLQWEKIFAFCKEHNKALEINSWPERTDLPDTLIKEAIEHGVKLIIDSDSHATEHMDLLKYGVYNARRGWATKGDILNTLEYNKFIEWLKS
ncbi:MAG TPA: PHP domain-containing protein [Candidatus Saccharimonadales bacterium]|nr:PHP domain-containing protein [Candidatus Saccharimonadales bacterium]